MRRKIFNLLAIAVTLAFVLCLGFPAFAQSSVAQQPPVAPATPFAVQLKLLAIATAVYGVLQAFKKVVPLKGIAAVAANVLLSSLGVIVAVNPDQLFSLSTLTTVLTTAAAAAGVHGTGKAFSNDSSGGSVINSPIARAGVAALLCVAMIGLTGCPKFETQAYRGIVGAKAFTKSVGQAHAECGTRDANDHWQSAHNKSETCVALDKAIAAKDVAIDLLETYCSSSQFDSGGACTPPTDKTVKNQVEVKLRSAIAIYGQAEADLKNLLK